MGRARKFEDKDLVGRDLGLWTLVKTLGSVKKSGKVRIMCRVRCECGTVKDITASSIVSGQSKSCGCRRSELTRNKSLKHGFANRGKKTSLYNVWITMKSRCSNKNLADYYLYGGRGISVCKEWRQDFMAFRAWAESNGYRKGLHIDRINNEGDYSPKNCRFVTCQVNASNKRNNVFVSIDGVVSTMAQAARNLGRSDTYIRRLLRDGGALLLRR